MPVSSPNSLQTVVLIGFMGCGKSCVSRRLATLLGWPVLDLDQQIESELGVTITEFFASHGEDVFRALETRHLHRALQMSGVLATGGGVVTRQENRELLRDAQKTGNASVVYLRAKPETLTHRIRRAPGVRPLIDGNRVLDWRQTRERVHFLLGQRSHWYEESADLVVDSDELSSHQVAQIVAAYVAPEKTLLPSNWKDEG